MNIPHTSLHNKSVMGWADRPVPEAAAGLLRGADSHSSGRKSESRPSLWRWSCPWSPASGRCRHTASARRWTRPPASAAAGTGSAGEWATPIGPGGVKKKEIAGRDQRMKEVGVVVRQRKSKGGEVTEAIGRRLPDWLRCSEMYSSRQMFGRVCWCAPSWHRRPRSTWTTECNFLDEKSLITL